MTETAPLQPSDLRRPPPRAWAWARRHPVVVDIAVVVAACLPQAVAVAHRAEDGWWGYLVLGVAAVALLFRRRWPLVVLVVVAFACVASPLVRSGAGFPLLPFAFALFAVAVSGPPRNALIGYAIGVGAQVLGTLPFSWSGTTPPLVSVLEPFSLIALLLATVVRHRRERERRLLERVNAHVENAALIERTRIASEMHDQIAHALTVVVSLANGAASIRDKNPQKADAAVEQIAVIGREALADMHRTLDLMRNVDVRRVDGPVDDGVLLHLDDLADRVRSAGLAVTLHVDGPPVPADAQISPAIYRIVQEALTNTLRHSEAATAAVVTIRHRPPTVQVVVEDDGGVAGPAIRRGHGLAGIERRAAAHGGHAASGPRPGGGWRTEATLKTSPRGSVDD